MVAPSVPILTDLASCNMSQCQTSQSPNLTIRPKKTLAAADEDSDLGHGHETSPSQVLLSEQLSLEDRVAELESKIATLSHLLATSTLRSSSPSLLPRNPLLSVPSSPLESLSHASVPYLESPNPSSMRRRLSEVLLREDSHPSLPSLNPSDGQDRRKLNGLAEETEHSHNQQNPETLVTEHKNPPTSSLSSSHHQQPIPETSPQSTPVQQKWMDYLESYQESTLNVDVQMEEFVRVPWKLEYLLNFGFYICIDSFLYVVTVLPLKFMWSILLMVTSWTGKYRFHRRHFYTLIQVFIIYFTYRVVLVPISIGHLYHWIRGQAMLKLYVLIAIVEVFDRLMCCMGQDCLDSMYWNTTRRPRSMRMLVSVTVVMVYVICHTFILFVHVATLNVAINSADHALLTVLISGNFAEIKSTVFKKYNKRNLFKVTASDICERFKLALFLSLVLILNWCQGMDLQTTIDYLIMCAYVWAAELLADWIKHSFITKFNFISSKVYSEYALLLAGDVTGIGHEGVNLDHSHAVVKRIGFAQIPLVCVMLRLLTEAGRYYSSQLLDSENKTWRLPLLTVALWGVLFGIKLLLGTYLQRICLAKLEAAPAVIKTPKKEKNE